MHAIHDLPGCNKGMEPTHRSLEPEVARREQRIEVVRRIETATAELAEAAAALVALDEAGAVLRAARAPVQPRLLTLPAAEALRVAMTKLHGLIRSGALPSVQIGTARRVRWRPSTPTSGTRRGRSRLSRGVGWP
ncbi:MAG: helix-turn-helix domain-containing protein [Actinomycetota bacterium]|nr:helix-turn-helix domain-containing protein [Actinomycetota bacterium]